MQSKVCPCIAENEHAQSSSARCPIAGQQCSTKATGCQSCHLAIDESKKSRIFVALNATSCNCSFKMSQDIFLFLWHLVSTNSDLECKCVKYHTILVHQYTILSIWSPDIIVWLISAGFLLELVHELSIVHMLHCTVRVVQVGLTGVRT